MFRQYRSIERGEFFVVAADCSAGGLDYSAVQFLSKTKLDVPLVYHSKALATIMTNDIFPVLERLHDVTGVKPMVAYERNNGGVFEMDRLASLNRAGKYDVFKMPTIGSDYSSRAMGEPDSVRLGWDTNTATRPAMLTDLKEAVDNQLIGIYDRATIEEMFSFVVVQTTTAWKAQAEQGAHDDLVMSLAIAWKVAQMVTPPNPTWTYSNYQRPAVADMDLGI